MADEKYKPQQQQKSDADKAIRPGQNKVETDMSKKSADKDLNKSSSSQFQNTKK